MSEFELENWLQSATVGLSDEVQPIARQELAAHFEDAVEAYMDEGMAEASARRQALQDLGAAALVANGFNEVHHGRALYFRALLTSIMVLVALLLPPLVAQLLGVYSEELNPTLNGILTVSDLVSTGGALYVIYTIWQMLSWRLEVRIPDSLYWGLGWLIAVSGADVFYRLVYGDAFYASTERTIFEVETLTAASVIALGVVARIVLGIALVVLARHLWRGSAALYGLGKPVAVVLVMMACGLGTVGIWVHLEVTTLAALANLMAILAHLLLWNVLILLFFRLIYRSPLHPTRFA